MASVQNPLNLKCYSGNDQVKNDGVVQPFTALEYSEYKKCMDDPIYFAKKYVKIIHPDRGLVSFDLYPYQEKMYDLVEDNRFVIVLAPRQSGKSIAFVVYLLWYAIFKPDQTIVILANKGDTAREMLSRITLALENLPFFLQPGCKALNKGSIEFSNNSRIFARGTSNSSVRGIAATLIYLDEFAFVQHDTAFYTSTYPVISAGKKTKVIITSTANGIGNVFYKLWEGALTGVNEYKPFKVDWQDVPGRDEVWKKQTIANTSQQQFDQEFENLFLSKGSTLIDSATLLELRSRDPIEIAKEVRYYSKPAKGRRYCISVDVSKGRGQDFSAISIIDVTSEVFEVVANYSNNLISPLLFPIVIHDLARLYNNAYVIVESNDVGSQVVHSLVHELEYDNVFSSSGKNSKSLGLQMTQKVKRIGCSHFKDLLESGTLQVHDKTLISEICSFEARGSSWEAARGCHDDLVMTLVIFGYFASTPQFAEVSDISLRQLMFSKSEITDFENEIVPFGIIDRGDGEALDRSIGRIVGEFNDGKFKIEVDDDFGWAVVHEEDPDKWH